MGCVTDLWQEAEKYWATDYLLLSNITGIHKSWLGKKSAQSTMDFLRSLLTGDLKQSKLRGG